jgi:NAD(P)-dependent dehydrogenase (short-subunit alcohol dehydrogenase family)
MRALVTGAGRGIGLGLVQAMAARGDRVAGTARGDAPAVPGVDWHALDVTDAGAVAALGAGWQGPLDLLVCNAGIYPARGARLEDGFPPDAWAQGFAVNVAGVFLCVQALLPALRRARAGRIAIIASAMGSDARAPGGAYIYRASKAAAINLGRNLATDLAPQGIAVGIYHPGWVRTDMGGSGADIDIATSVAGLLARFDALDIADTGCFRDHDGSPIAF